MLKVNRTAIARDIRKNVWWMALWLLLWIVWDYSSNWRLGFGLTTTLLMAGLIAVLGFIGRFAWRGWIVVGQPGD